MKLTLERMLMKQVIASCMILFMLTSCNLPATTTATPQINTPIIVPTNTTSSGGVVTLNNVSFTVPLGVAKDAKESKEAKDSTAARKRSL